MKYIRIEGNQILDIEKLRKDFDIKTIGNFLQVFHQFGITPIVTFTIVKQADTIEELIQLNDIVFYWQPNDDKEHCILMTYPYEIESMKFSIVTKLLIPSGEDYECVAKAKPTFEIIAGKRYCVQRGKLELL